MADNEEKRNAADDEIIITRIINAPREQVWQAWTQPEYASRWWGPKGFTSPVNKIDLRVGGKYLSCMRSPEGQDFWSTGEFREIVPPERLVMTDSFADSEGNVVSAAYYGMGEGFPLELLITVTFEEVDGKTKLTLRHTGLEGVSTDMRENMRQGWNESFDKLENSLKMGGTGAVRKSGKTTITANPGERELVATHTVDAPRDLVFKVITDPALIPRWWGPRALTTTVDKKDVRPGGEWRFIQRDSDGNIYAFNGVYREVVPPERLVYTFNFEAMPPGHESVETVTLEEQDGRTLLTNRDVFQTVEDRDASLQSGMEQGIFETMERLDELLDELQRQQRAA